MVLDDIRKLKTYAQVACDISREEYVDTVCGFWDYIESQIDQRDAGEQDKIYSELKYDAENFSSIKFRMFLCSFFLQKSFDKYWSKMLCDEVLLADKFDCDEANFLVQQLISLEFRYPGISDKVVIEQLYNKIVDYWREKYIKYKFKNQGTLGKVLVVSTQILGERHAPTKTLLERLQVLEKELGMEILVIHTREVLTQAESFPFYKAQRGSVCDEYTGLKEIKWSDGYKFKMYQPEKAMPNDREMDILFDLVNDFGPSEIIVFGDRSIVGDLLADHFPTICIPFGFSVLTPKYNQYMAIFRKLNELDYAMIDSWNIERNKYIEGVFTFKFIEQTTKFTRKELNVPENRFVISIIGNRIGSDLTFDFINMLESLKDDRWHIIFAGAPEGFDYKLICRRYPILEEHSTYVGYVKDILALLECCDLYVNPPRFGGGFSVAEAFSKGIPGVTFNYGDVAAAAGEDFCVQTFDEMKNIIERYMNDSDFYKEMSDKAIERAEILQDSKKALSDLLEEFRKRYRQC